VIANTIRARSGHVNHFTAVMVGLVPAIYVLLKVRKKDMDARDKRGHDAG
jgi:hypothetical protein